MDHNSVSGMWASGDAYEQYVGRWSRQVAPLFLSWLNVPAGRRWLDVGCGTGALSSAIVDHCSPLSVTGIDPSEEFLKKAKESLTGRVMFQQGSATAIPREDESFAVIVSGLVLNFVSDQPAALTEMARVSGNGGVLGAYVWDYAGNMQLMRFFWDAAAEIDPADANLDEGIRFSLCRPESLRKLFEAAGLNGIEVVPIEIPTVFESFAAYWQPFLGGQGSAPAYVVSLSEDARARLRECLRARIPNEHRRIDLISSTRLGHSRHRHKVDNVSQHTIKCPARDGRAFCPSRLT